MGAGEGLMGVRNKRYLPLFLTSIFLTINSQSREARDQGGGSIEVIRMLKAASMKFTSLFSPLLVVRLFSALRAGVSAVMKLKAERKHEMKQNEKKWMMSKGMSKEEISEFERSFEADKKRLKRNREAIKDNSYSFIYLDMDHDEDGCSLIKDVVDTTENEDAWLQKIHIDMLRSFLGEMSEEDRRILYVSFSGVYDYDQILMKELGVTRSQIQYRRKCLLSILRKKFGIY